MHRDVSRDNKNDRDDTVDNKKDGTTIIVKELSDKNVRSGSSLSSPKAIPVSLQDGWTDSAFFLAAL
jgi:hypothetical protein